MIYMYFSRYGVGIGKKYQTAKATCRISKGHWHLALVPFDRPYTIFVIVYLCNYVISHHFQDIIPKLKEVTSSHDPEHMPFGVIYHACTDSVSLNISNLKCLASPIQNT